MARIHGPSALLPAALKVLCAQLLPRLQLIPELRRWLANNASADLFDENHEPVQELWDSLAQGFPLLILLDLLGTTGNVPSSMYAECHNAAPFHGGLSGEECLSEFLRRIQVLEIQGRLSYGEVFRVNDLLSGCPNGFMKVLQTVRRVLNCLEATYPGIYEMPIGHQKLRDDILDGFLSEEKQHLTNLQYLTEGFAAIGAKIHQCPVLVDCLSVYAERMVAYQTHLVGQLESLVYMRGKDERWHSVFSLDDTARYISGIGAYQSYCADYPRTRSLINELLRESSPLDSIHDTAGLLSRIICCPIKRIGYYPALLSRLLSLTNPIDDASAFASLCTAQHKLHQLWRTVLEVGYFVRTGWTVASLKARAFYWKGPDPELLGILLMDDYISTGLQGSEEIEFICFAFFFEKSLLLCRPLRDADCPQDSDIAFWNNSTGVTAYPVEPWNLGIAATMTNPFNLYTAIPTASIKRVYRPEADSFSLDIIWSAEDVIKRTTLNFGQHEQLNQWVSLFLRVAPQGATSFSDIFCTPQPSSDVVNSEELDHLYNGGISYLEEKSLRRMSKPRPWSIIARKESTPASSLHHAKWDQDLPTSPSVLPFLFDGQCDLPSPLTKSPLSIAAQLEPPFDDSDVGDSKFQASPSPPPDSGLSSLDGIPVLDLTGEIIRTEQFPSGYGGYADIWVGEWDSPSGKRKVGVKVLRGRVYHGSREETLRRRLRREIRVWHRLDHENIIPLYGTCADFGPYTSMVCPWMENGSVRKYVESKGDSLNLISRLKLLCEIAAGLAYLHSFSVVHGDLTGSNILINERGQACLCDFGMSSLIEEFLGTSYFTTNIGGAVRWAAPELYNIHGVCEDGVTQITTHSDIYSYGSVTLEILSGDVPYNHLKSDGQVLIELNKGMKSPRPATGLITDELWSFIQECWSEPPAMRPLTTDVSLRMQQFHSSNQPT